MMAKPMKTFQLHYPMIQFLTISFIQVYTKVYIGIQGYTRVYNTGVYSRKGVFRVYSHILGTLYVVLHEVHTGVEVIQSSI